MNNIKQALLDNFTLAEIKDEHELELVDRLYEVEPRFKWEVENDIIKEIEKLKKELNSLTKPEPRYVNELPRMIKDILQAVQERELYANKTPRLDIELFSDMLDDSKISDLDQMLTDIYESTDYYN